MPEKLLMRCVLYNIETVAAAGCIIWQVWVPTRKQSYCHPRFYVCSEGIWHQILLPGSYFKWVLITCVILKKWTIPPVFYAMYIYSASENCDHAVSAFTLGLVCGIWRSCIGQTQCSKYTILFTCGEVEFYEGCFYRSAAQTHNGTLMKMLS